MNRDLKIGLCVVIPILAICAVFPPLRGIFFTFLLISGILCFGWGCCLLSTGVCKLISKIMNEEKGNGNDK